MNCKVEDPDLSDHYAVHCKLTLDKPTARRVEKTYRKLRSVDMEASGAPNDNFRKNICSEDDLRSRIFGTFVVKFLACLPLLGFSDI